MLWASSARAVDQTPNATQAESLTTCTTANAHTTMDDDPDAPDSVFCEADDNNDSPVIMFNLTDPGTLDDTTDAQVFAIFVKRTGGGGNVPTIQLDAYDGTNCADLHEAGVPQSVSSTSGELITESWTSSGVSGSADVCVRVACTTAGSGGSGRSCDSDAVEWRAALDAPPAGRRRTSLVE